MGNRQSGNYQKAQHEGDLVDQMDGPEEGEGGGGGGGQQESSVKGSPGPSPKPSPPASPTHGRGQVHVPLPLQRRRKGSRSAITYLLCGIYALVVIVLGLVFPVSTSITTTTPADPKYYLEIYEFTFQIPAIFYQHVFHCYIYIISLVFLVYLHCYLLRQRGEERVNRGNIRLVSNNQLDSPDKSAFAVAENSEIDSQHSGKENVRSRTPSDGDVDPYESPRPVTYDSVGVNFYLRLGAIGFGAGSMIHDGFRIAQVFETDNYWTCYGLLHMVMSSMHLIFCFFQTYFLFKNHRIVINKHKAFVRFGLTHIIATNICIWALATVIEIDEDYETRVNLKNVMALLNGNTTENATTVAMMTTTTEGEDMTAKCFQYVTLARKASPYLFPCTIQYSLIAAAIVFKMYTNVGKIGRHVLTIDGGDNRTQRDCHKANKGLFLGLFIAILTLIAISCFFVFDEKFKNSDTASMIFYITEITLLFLSCMVVLIGFFKLQQLKFSGHDDNSFMAPLLVIALFGLCTMNTFLVVSSATSIEEYGLIGMFSLGTALLAFMQSALQTIFILDGLRRCAENDDQISSKPGRTLVTFLLLCNLSLWCVNTFEAKKIETVSLHTTYYGYLPWSIISHLCIPLIIFFRFHSTVCLSEIWVSAYVMKKHDL
jgi:hypothetical protein